MVPTVRSELEKAATQLAQAGVDSPLLDAQLIMARVLGRSRLNLIAHPEQPVSPDRRVVYAEMVSRRAQREPLAYILGSREFFSLEMEVTEGVLVPRPETELLVEITVKKLNGRTCRIADVGTGSGAIAVALAVNLPAAELLATDASKNALEVAARNAEKYGVTDRIAFRGGDLVDPLAETGLLFDAIVCNPPYVPSGELEGLQPEVAWWEPREALDGGPDGLEFYRKLAPAAVCLLAEGGFLAVEVGAGQADFVEAVLRSSGFTRVDRFRDLAGTERVLTASK